jgi:hypothetical protein
LHFFFFFYNLMKNQKVKILALVGPFSWFKPYVIEEIRLHTTRSSQHNHFQEKSNFHLHRYLPNIEKFRIAKCSSLSQYRKWVIFLWKRSKMKPKFQSFLYLENINHYFFFIFDILDRAHIGGRFRRSSRLVKVDFAFSLVKT